MTPPHDKSSNASAISQYIDALPMFTDLTERERGILAGVFQCRRVDHGHELCREGDRGQSFFIVAKGILEVYKELPDGRREKLADIGPNNLMGQVALIDGKPRSATCIARGPAIALECTRDDFDRLFKSGSPFALKIVDRVVVDLAKRLREANRQLHELYANPGNTLRLLEQAALDIQQTITV
ncbi:MAG: cyclic nucleotide-binding domain-containing protein [Myxococcota bacterium]|nr:cyclic nucleotide-binding domain-containing protein [Myxococcota bacterium]